MCKMGYKLKKKFLWEDVPRAKAVLNPSLMAPSVLGPPFGEEGQIPSWGDDKGQPCRCTGQRGITRPSGVSADEDGPSPPSSAHSTPSDAWWT